MESATRHTYGKVIAVTLAVLASGCVSGTASAHRDGTGFREWRLSSGGRETVLRETTMDEREALSRIVGRKQSPLY